MDLTTQYLDQFTRIFDRNPQLSDIKPSKWAENRVTIPDYGKLSYDDTPYCRQIIDFMSPFHPMRRGAVMKGSQIRFSSNVIIPALGYIIEEDPQNTIYMVGDSELITAAGDKLDLMIDKAGLLDFLSPAVKRKRRTKDGNTDKRKNFAGKYIEIAANSDPKAIAQKDLLRIFLDDFDMMDGSSKVAGDFLNLIEMRAASSLNNYKLLMISTPLLKGRSNIEKAFQRGDQRRYFVHCECCHEPIVLKWTVKEGELINGLTGQVAKGPGGIFFDRDTHDRVIRSSVGYICYLCNGFFTDRNKRSMLIEADWTPTATAIAEDYFSWHISALYAPVRAFDWRKYAEIYATANPSGQEAQKREMQTFVNTCLGETWAEEKEETKASTIMKNCRGYSPALIGGDDIAVPEKQSIADGNGRIILITCAADMNGKVEDARLDYEVVAWTESGATYSITHGSIGTFIPRESQIPEEKRVDRARWTYEFNKPNSVWTEFNKVLAQTLPTDTGRMLTIGMAGLDCGHFTTDYAYPYLEKVQDVYPIVGLRGEKEDKYVAHGHNGRMFKNSVERPDRLWLLQVNLIKDYLASWMRLRWDSMAGEPQPPNFMNYPQPERGLYMYEGFFQHYEAEQRTTVANPDGTDVAYRWEKKTSAHQNHFFDCRVYNIALREVFIYQLGKELKQKDFTWADYVGLVRSMIND